MLAWTWSESLRAQRAVAAAALGTSRGRRACAASRSRRCVCGVCPRPLTGTEQSPDRSKYGAMSDRTSEQVSVTFHDVAVYFSEEEWGNLEEWQKELYRNVVEEIHAALLSLGYTIANPDVLVHLRKEEEQHLRACLDSKGRETIKEKATTSVPIVKPDILLRIKQKEEPCYKNNRCSMGRERDGAPGTGGHPMIPSVSIDVEEDEPRPRVRPHSEERESSPFSLGFKDEETYATDPQDDMEDESCVITTPEVYSWTKQAVAPYPRHRSDAGRGRVNISTSKTEPRMRLMDRTPPGEYAERGNLRGSFSGKVPAHTAQRADKGRTSSHEHWTGQYSGKYSKQRMETAALIQRHFTKIAIPVVQQRVSTSGIPTLYHESDRRFGINAHLRSPQGIPNGVGPYNCRQCDKSFDRPSELKLHQRAHRVQVYKCTECDKIFKQVSSLKAHHRIHTGERPYKCTLCEKSFNHASSFTIHQRTHTGNRPYKCSECDKRFSNKSNLLKHERIHSRVRPYQCLDCVQSFTYKSHLLIHQISHSGERPQ